MAAAACAAQQVRESGPGFVGSVGCSSSSCHGGAGPKRSQFITWTQQDVHARAFVILTSARSARMAESLGLGNAQTSPRCTVCHSPFQSVPAAHMRSAARADEGVSCETCHGAAESWLRGHTRPDWSYATRVGAGMRDLRSLYVRANACVACHQNVEPDLLDNAHPELNFELARQSVAEPKHWRDDDPWIGARSWLTGQAVALREISWALARRPNDDREKLRWSALGWLLAKVVGVQTSGATLSANTGDFVEMQKTADDLARQAARWPFDQALLAQLLRTFAASDAEFAPANDNPRGLLSRRAERLVPAIEQLASALEANGGHVAIDAELQALREAMRPPEQFDAAAFAARLQALSQALARRTR